MILKEDFFSSFGFKKTTKDDENVPKKIYKKNGQALHGELGIVREMCHVTRLTDDASPH